ncbi:MAG TPA: cell shape determination protein CcmA, partial [Sulfurospirillum arcachonense]|nr:cell shape determination protein CcmA [Sulfurospirillum arcachonense]
MAIFDKSNAESPASSETTIIASGAKIDGVFNCASRLHVDGEVTGEVHSKSIVTIGKGGKIKGPVTANRLIVNGLFEGNADCDSVEVLAGGKFLGKVVSKELMIEAKAQFEGESKIKRDNETTKTPI